MKFTAELFRKKVGSGDLDATAKKLTTTLATGGISSVIVGGYALQEHGYHRNTIDVDVIVPSIPDACEYLSIRGFKPTGSKAILYDRENGVEVNLLPAGGQATRNSPLSIPTPPASPKPMTVMDIAGLIEMKLNVFLGNQTAYLKRKVDVMESIKANKLKENFFHSSNQNIQECWRVSTSLTGTLLPGYPLF